MINNPWVNTLCPTGSVRSNCPRGQNCLYKHPGDDNENGPAVQVSTAITVPERRSVRRKQPNKKYTNIEKMCEEPAESPLCVACNVFVDSGPFCVTCQRWWHYKCADTTKSAVGK